MTGTLQDLGKNTLPLDLAFTTPPTRIAVCEQRQRPSKNAVRMGDVCDVWYMTVWNCQVCGKVKCTWFIQSHYSFEHKAKQRNDYVTHLVSS